MVSLDNSTVVSFSIKKGGGEGEHSMSLRKEMELLFQLAFNL